MNFLKHLLGYLSAVALLAMGTLAAIGLSVLTDNSDLVPRHRLNSALSESDHLRNLNNQLSRQLERQKWEEQMR